LTHYLPVDEPLELMVFVKTGAGIFFLKFSAQRRIADLLYD